MVGRIIEARPEELRVLIEEGFPPEATAKFSDVSMVAYDKAGGEIRAALKSKNKVEGARLMTRLGGEFRANYKEAIRLAREGR